MKYYNGFVHLSIEICSIYTYSTNIILGVVKGSSSSENSLTSHPGEMLDIVIINPFSPRCSFLTSKIIWRQSEITKGPALAGLYERK